MSEQTEAILAGFGPLSHAMTGHILLMNVLAPALAVASGGALGRASLRAGGLVAPTLVQLVLLWGWHAPPSLSAAMDRPLLHILMQASLLAAALWFWGAVAGTAATGEGSGNQRSGQQGSGGQWRALLALLSTSKLFCLLGVLLTFAPRPLYPGLAPHGAAALEPLTDQQLAGLMMLIACPLSYLVAAVVVASRWLTASDEGPRRREGGTLA